MAWNMRLPLSRERINNMKDRNIEETVCRLCGKGNLPHFDCSQKLNEPTETNTGDIFGFKTTGLGNYEGFVGSSTKQVNTTDTSELKKVGNIFGMPIETFDPDNLLEEMKKAKDGTSFVLGENVIKHHEGEDTMEVVMCKVFRGKDEPHLQQSKSSEKIEYKALKDFVEFMYGSDVLTEREKDHIESEFALYGARYYTRQQLDDIQSKQVSNSSEGL